MALGNLPSAKSATGAGVEATPVVNVDASGNPLFLAALPVGTDRSGTITTGANNGIASAKTLAPANAARLSLTGQNISSADLWVSEMGSAGVGQPGSFKITPGNAFSIATQRAVTIIGTVDGQAYSATET